MTLPDPDDPHFQAEVRETLVYLLGFSALLLGFMCLVIAYLTQ